MQPFQQHQGIVAPLWRADIDTDQIVPKQFLTGTARTGYARALFHGWRSRPDGLPDPGFPLNQPQYAGASVLATGPNFGCGSSREHAAWALLDSGYRAVIAPSFADIFLGNAVNNGLLPVVLPSDDVRRIVERAGCEATYTLMIDLRAQRVSDRLGLDLPFTIDPAVRHRLLEGLDATAAVLRYEAAIAAFERQRDGGR